MVGPTVVEVAATLEALCGSPCDTLVLAAPRPGAPLSGLTELADWRLGGRVARALARAPLPEGESLLLGGGPALPVARVVVVHTGPRALEALVQRLRGLEPVGPVGLCPDDFGLGLKAVRRALGSLSLLVFVGDVASPTRGA